LNRAEREWPWLGGMILHQWQPNASLNDPQWGFALVDAENNPLPLLDALRSVERVDAATNGLYPARNPYVKYNGLWTFSDLGADAGWINDSQFTFDFHGSEVALSARKGEYVAYMYVTVDDSPANALPTDNDGNSYVVLRSGDLRPEIALIPLATDLSVETHRLQIVVDELVPDELSNRWPVVGFAVSSGDLAEPHNRQIRIAAITTVVALIAVFVSASQVNWAPLIVLLSRLSRRISPLFQVILSGITSLILMLSMYLTWSDGMPTWFRRESVQIGLSLLTSGVIYFNQFGIIIAGIALVVLFVLIFNRVEIGLMLIIFWSPFFLFPVELYRFAFPTTEVILWVTFAAWLLRTITAWGQWFKDDSNSTKALRLSLCPLDVVMLLVVVIAAISLFWAEYRGAASVSENGLPHAVDATLVP